MKDVVVDFQVQKGKPTDPSVFRDWMARQMIVVVAKGIMPGAKYIRPLHSLMQWISHRENDKYDGLLIEVVGKRVSNQEPA